MLQEPVPRTEDIDHMKRSIAKKDGQRICEFFQQGEKGHWHCQLLEFVGQSCAMITPHGRIEWAITSAHTLLQRYWPARTGMENQLPSQISQWLNRLRKRTGAKGTSPTILAPLVISRLATCLTVRHMHHGPRSALLFEELLLELPANRLRSLGLTPRETEVLRWLAQGKSSFEIARILTLSDRTVSKHLERVYLRLGVENRHAAIAMVHEELRRTAPG